LRAETKDAVASTVLPVLAGFPEVKVAILFGSAARDQLRSSSDVDIAVGAGHALAWDVKTELQARLSEALEREADLIDLETLEGLLWDTLWSEATFVLWDHDLVVKYAGKAQGFAEDVRPQMMAEIERRLERAFGPV